MSLEIDRALREGYERTVSRSGLLLVALFVAFGLANAVLSQSFSVELFEFLEAWIEQNVPEAEAQEFPGGPGQTPLALPIPLPVLGLGLVVSFVVAELFSIVAVRVFASEHTDSIPRGLATRRIGLATINGLVGGLVSGILMAIGLVLLVVPGIFLFVSFYFVRQEVAVGDENFVDALGNSWNLAKGNRWELLGLAVIVFVILLLVSSPAIIVQFFSPLAGSLLSVFLGAAGGVYAAGVTTRAYVQLKEGAGEGQTDREKLLDPDAEFDDENSSDADAV